MTYAMTKEVFKPRSNFVKCAGQAEDGTMLCGYRTGCARYVRESATFQDWADFWKAGDDCPQYVTAPTA